MQNKRAVVITWVLWLTVATILLCGAVPVAVLCLHGQTDFPCGPKVLVFHAKWCKFCPSQAEINQLQTDYPNCEVIDVDIDARPELRDEYHVTRVPRFFICDANGCKTTTSFSELRGWLNAYQ
jgi:thiol-disulfide isomerase/thioredoxin